MPLLRGAIPSSRRALAMAPHIGPYLSGVTVPDAWAVVCPHYDIAGNDTYGTCVTAEEVNAKLALSAVAGINPITIPLATTIAWCRSHGVLNGAELSDVLESMASDGIKDASNVLHKIGPYHTVDYTNWIELTAAIYTCKTVKIAVSADQLLRVHTSRNGWYLVNSYRDGGIDHCVGLHGYGTIASLAQQLGAAVPSGVDATQKAVLLYTWASVGIVSWKSLQDIMYRGEAWARMPGDISPTLSLPAETPVGPGIGPPISGELYVDGLAIQGVLTQTLTGQTGTFQYFVQRDARTGKYTLTPKVL